VISKFKAEAVHDRYRELRDSGIEYAASRGELPHGLLELLTRRGLRMHMHSISLPHRNRKADGAMR